VLSYGQGQLYLYLNWSSATTVDALGYD